MLVETAPSHAYLASVVPESFRDKGLIDVAQELRRIEAPTSLEESKRGKERGRRVRPLCLAWGGRGVNLLSLVGDQGCYDDLFTIVMVAGHLGLDGALAKLPTALPSFDPHLL